jgi:RecA/RadA recombinase
MAKNSKMGFDPSAEIQSTLDKVAFKMADADTLDDVQPMSSGLLIIDCMTGGGIRPAMYTSAGKEQTGKTTLALTILASAIHEKIHTKSVRDYEGSTGNSIPYVTSIMQTYGVNLNKDELFGKKDPKTGKWLVTPVIRYSASTKGMVFFNWMAALLRRLPDKKMLNNKWYYVYEDDKQFAHLKEHGDSTMPKKYGKGIYIEAANGGQLEGLVIVDSYPNMNPSEKDEDEGDNSLALQARMFSKNLPRIKGSLASKKFAIVGVNQLRDIPMAMYGPKENEPGGQALKFYSDVRFRLTSRVLTAAPLWAKPGKTDKAHEYEPSWDGRGRDKYKYVHVRFAKNKLGGWLDDGWLRIWARDADGIAHGIDPVYDTMLYLRLTGQLTGSKRTKMQLNLRGILRDPEGSGGGDPALFKKPKDVDWELLKAWILGDKEAKIKICKKLKLEKPFALRKVCFKQIQSGLSEILLSEQRDKGASDKDNDSEDSE